MALKISLILVGISIGLLVIYGIDVIVGGGTAGNGFLPLNAMERGIGFGGPPIVLSIVAFFISRKESSKPLRVMIIVSGILIIIGGIVSISSGISDNTARMAGEGGGLIAIGAFIITLGVIKLKKSKSEH
jgi:hypothetical protein